MDGWSATAVPQTNGHHPHHHHDELQHHHPQPNPPPAPPVDLGAKFAAELPTVLNDLIPLSFIVERVVSQAHHELANLAETLPHQPDQARKRAIVDYVLQTRRQILKLLVLVRWSSEADNVTKCMNIVGFLARQNYEFDHSVSSLTEVKGMLAGARVRNYDLSTSLSVLRTGIYTRLPSVIREGFSQPAKLSDEAVLDTLAELDNVLRWRLACVERIPSRMSKYWIKDGRAWFRVEGMWEASFTFGGGEAEETAPWYLLSLKFLFRVRDARGVWSSTPTGPMKDHIIDLCNRELARRPTPSPPEPPASGAVEGAEGGKAVETAPGEKAEPPSSQERDAPLVRGYTFLQRLALTYQLESLHIQALQLSSTLWSGSLRIEMNKDRTELKVGYWSPPKQDPPPVNRNPAAPPPVQPTPPSLIFSIGATSSSTTNAAPTAVSQSEARLKALERALDGLGSSLTPANEVGATTADKDEEGVEDRLRIEWNAEGLSQEVRRGVTLDLDSDLDLEALLVRITTVHARDTTLQLHQHLLSEFKEEDLELVPSSSSSSADAVPQDDDCHSIRLHLFSTHSVLCSFNPLSGKIEFKAPGEVSSAREARLRNAADKVNAAGSQTPPPPLPGAPTPATPKTPLQLQLAAAGETLIRVRASTILDEVESRAAYLGLNTTRRLPLRSVDLARFGQATRSCLFVKLMVGQASPSPSYSMPPKATTRSEAIHYLVLVMTEQGFRFALISTREGSDQVQSWLGIDELGWLEKGARNRRTDGEADWVKGEGEQEAYGFDVTIEDLRSLYSYCARRIAFHLLESSLYARRIPFRTVSFSPPSATAAASTAANQEQERSTPYLVVQSQDLVLKGSAALGGMSMGKQRIAYSNVALQCFVRGDVFRTTLALRLHHSALAVLTPSSSSSNPFEGISNLSLSRSSSSSSSSPADGTLTLWHDGSPSAAVTVFLSAYALIVRAVMLARHRLSERDPEVEGKGNTVAKGR